MAKFEEYRCALWDWPLSNGCTVGSYLGVIAIDSCDNMIIKEIAHHGYMNNGEAPTPVSVAQKLAGDFEKAIRDLYQVMSCTS